LPPPDRVAWCGPIPSDEEVSPMLKTANPCAGVRGDLAAGFGI